MENYLVKANRWKNSGKLNEELQYEIDHMTDEQLKDAFFDDIQFGTAGLRGVMGVGTNKLNVVVIHKATLGFGRFLLKNEENAKERGVVIAHDNRFHDEDFTNAAASVLASLGIKVYIFDALRPTPELSYAIRYLNACGGINITASHNPKQYNGFKIYNSEGNQLILAQSDKVAYEISLIEDELSIETKHDASLIQVIDKSVDEAYYQMCMDTSLNKTMDKSNVKIVYTPQHGTGYIPVTTVLKRLGYQVIEVTEQCFPSHSFENTLSPNPEEKRAYDLAIQYALKYDADIVCTTDPDCDRVGIVLFDEHKNPVYMTGNQTGSILVNYILSQRKQQGILPSNGVMYNTIVTSPLGEKVAEYYGVSTEKTLTGFKYIGDKIARALENNGKVFQIGYEESYGYLLNSEVRDKDGVQSIMMICEMASYYKHQGKTLLQMFDEVQKMCGYYVESQYVQVSEGVEGKAKLDALMRKFREDRIQTIAGEPVYISEDYLTLKKIENGIETSLPYESSNVLRYVFEDGSFVAIRPSGTEPKCKFYFALGGRTKEVAQERHDRVKAFILEIANH